METQWIDYLSKVTVYISVSYLLYYYLLSNDANLEPLRDLGIDGQALQVAQ